MSAISVYDKSQIPDVASGKFRFVFMSPESTQDKYWRKFFCSSSVFKDRLSVLAVDEAHCISEWGKGFRTPFSNIGGLRAFIDVPIMALSALASAPTQATITESLNMNDPVLVSGSLNRPNIFFSAGVIKGLARDLNGLATLVKSSNSNVPKTIIFTQTKVLCPAVGMYHANLTSYNKAFVHEQYKRGIMRILVATVAYGMGMDIPDIQLVIIYDPPTT